MYLSIHKKHNKTRLRMIICNAKGDVIAISLKQIMICAPLLAECKATLYRLQTTSALGINDFIIEGDLIKVISLIRALQD